MSKDQRPPYYDLNAWVKAFQKDAYFLMGTLEEWYQDAVCYAEGDHPELSRLAELTSVLTAWCIHHPSAKIDPLPLQYYAKMATAWDHEMDDTSPLDTGPSIASVRKHFRRALCVVDQLVIAAKGEDGFDTRWRPPLNDTDRRCAAYIDKRPGKIGALIADECRISHDHFRRRVARKLCQYYGYTNEGAGYYPPNGSVAPQSDHR